MLLIFFILGFLLAVLILPILENLVTIIEAHTECKVHEIALKVYKIKQQMGIIGTDDEEEQDQESNPIGFQTNAIGYSTEEENEQEEM